MFKNIRIGTKILAVMLLTSLTVLLVISIISYTEMLNLTQYSQNATIRLGMTSSSKSQDALLNQAEEYLLELAVEQANSVDSVFYEAQNKLIIAKDFVENLYDNANGFAGYVPPLPDQTEAGVLSAKYMLAPNVSMNSSLESELKLLSNLEYVGIPIVEHNPIYDNLYLGTRNGISYRNSISSNYNKSYDPRERYWFKVALEDNKEVTWLETYFDAYGDHVITAAIAFEGYDAGKTQGVIATDIILKDVEERILTTDIGEGGYSFMIDNKGDYIAHPNYEDEGFRKNIFGSESEQLIAVAEKMMDGEQGISIVDSEGISYYVAYAPLPTVGWAVAVTVPIDQVTLPAKEIQAIINDYTNEAQEYIHETLSDILMTFFILFATCSIVLVFFSFVFAQNLTKPIKELVKSAEEIGKGNLDKEIEVRNNDEIGQLANTFNMMAKDLKVYIEDLSSVIKEKEQINSELNVAANIQNDMLPRIFPVFSDIEAVQVFAKMIPAKEVGGDFYDIFYIDEKKTKLCCIVADVSGKGVPASLFMVIAKTLLKSNLTANADILDAVNKANAMLAEDNGSCMFVTAFVSILHLETGVFEYVNCGHNPPLLYKNGTEFSFMEINPSLPLAVMENAPYTREEITLNFNDIVYMYTDGINEAMDIENNIYGNDALQNALNNIKDRSDKNPEIIDAAIREDVNAFVGEAEPSDDMTTLVLQYTKKDVA